jgi:hypothetical protein
MATIGTFKKVGSEIQGEIVTLSVQTKNVRIVPEASPAYAETIGKTAAMQRAYDGRQPGDPVKAAQAIIVVSKAAQPPLRLVLGSDAYARAEQTDSSRLDELRAWHSVSESTDFPHGGTA